MDIDLATLRALEGEKDLRIDVLIDAIEQALLSAYHKTPGAHKNARAVVDRATGKVSIQAREELEEGEFGPEFDDTPHDFGRIATATARQIIVQRLRQAGDDAVLGQYAGKEGHLVSGIIQQSSDPRNVHVDLGEVEALLPGHEQVPTETYVHGERLRAYVLTVARGMKGPAITLSRTHPALVRKLFELEVP